MYAHIEYLYITPSTRFKLSIASHLSPVFPFPRQSISIFVVIHLLFVTFFRSNSSAIEGKEYGELGPRKRKQQM